MNFNERRSVVKVEREKSGESDVGCQVGPDLLVLETDPQDRLKSCQSSLLKYNSNINEKTTHQVFQLYANNLS